MRLFDGEAYSRAAKCDRTTRRRDGPVEYERKRGSEHNSAKSGLPYSLRCITLDEKEGSIRWDILRRRETAELRGQAYREFEDR